MKAFFSAVFFILVGILWAGVVCCPDYPATVYCGIFSAVCLVTGGTLQHLSLSDAHEEGYQQAEWEEDDEWQRFFDESDTFLNGGPCSYNCTFQKTPSKNPGLNYGQYD